VPTYSYQRIGLVAARINGVSLVVIALLILIEPAIIVAEVKKGDSTLVLRDNAGVPAGAG